MTDGPGHYGNREFCEVRALQPLHLTAEQYDIEENYDFVRVNVLAFRRSGPDDVYMAKGDTWVWKSDSSVTREGYKLCANKAEADGCMYVFV